VNAETPAFVHWVAGAENFTGLAGEQGHDIRYEPYLPPVGPAGRKLPGAKRWNKLTVLNADLAENESKLAAALRLMNFLYSDQASVALNWGVEGETYNTENGERVFAPVVLNDNDVYDQEKAKREYGLGKFAHRTPEDFLLSSLSPSIREYQAQVASQNDILADLPENLKVSAEKREEFDLIETPVRDYVDEMTLRFIYGDADIETEWDAYVQRAQDLGADRLADMYSNLDPTEF
jgi:putative aldouronate transport system substrate-binding protein